VLSVVFLLCVGFVLPAAAQSISGHIFEDQGYPGGAGRNYVAAASNGVVATVELYHTGALQATTTSAAGTGLYTFAGLTNGRTYVVRVVNSTVQSTLGGWVAGLVPVQTYRTDCSGGCPGAAPVAVADHVGGELPKSVDPGTGVLANAESVTTVALNGTGLAVNVDFGFNFDTIVNVNASGQGSLAQFITNANTLSGTDNSIFMIPDGTAHPGMNVTAGYATQETALSAGGKAFIINMGGVALPTITAASVTVNAYNEVTNLGGTNPNTNSVGSNSQCGPSVASGTTKLGTSQTALAAWTPAGALPNAIPAVEIQNCGDAQWKINGSGDTVEALAFHQCTLYVGASNVTVQDNLIGVHADGTISTATSGNFGISMLNGGSRIINHNYVRINNSGIRNDAQGSTGGDVYEYNEVTSPTTVQTDTFDGILLIGGGAGFNSDTIKYNYTHDLAGGGIELGFSSVVMTGEVIQQNTICSNGWFSTGNAPYAYGSPSTERVNVAIWDVAQGTTVTIQNNVITNSSGVGILVENSYGFTISQNSIYLNDRTADNLGPGIALFSNCSSCDPNAFFGSGYTGVTPNTGTENPLSPNYQMNYPVMTLATYTGGNLRVKGYVGGSTNLTIANAKVEIFVANNTDNNQNGQVFLGDGLSVPHGEGQTFVETFNADAQGLFDVTIPSGSFPPGVVITAGTTWLTSTATDSVKGSTSEFGPNILVQASATTIQGYVYYDANHNGTMDSGENWQLGTAVYAVLWDTTANTQAKVGGVVLGAQTIPFGLASDTGFFSFDNVTPGDTYQLYLTTTAPAAGGIYASQPGVAIPAGWINVNPNTASVSIPTTAAGPQIITQTFGLFHGLKVSGKVFKDNGSGAGGVANDGHLNGTEPGMTNIILTAKDSFSVLLDQETTDGGGNYTLWLPAIDTSSNAVGAVTTTISQVGFYTATGFDAGVPATGGAYNTTTLVFTFTPTWTNIYTLVNFGFIQSGNIFAPNGEQATVPGAVAIYAHQYTSVTGGTVTFAETATPSQPNYFNEILYQDTTANCTGTLASATYLAWNTAVTIPAGGGKVCLYVKEMVGNAASYGMQNTVTITSTFAYGSASVANTTLTVVDVTTIESRGSGDLQLVKSTYIDAPCANPASPVYVTTTQSAQSGNCIKYQIQATNAGSSPLSVLFINDTAPPYTTLQALTPAASVSAGTTCTGLTAPSLASGITITGSGVQATFTGTMPAGCVATFVYEVKLN
jgi:parallel beta-helix repeat protein